MLELRPNCELCDKDLPVTSSEAMICTYECTYCTACVEALSNVCPNCGGGFTPRPIRPSTAWREGLSCEHQRPSDKRVHSKYRLIELADYIEKIKSIDPRNR